MKIIVRIYLNDQIINIVPADSKYHAKQIIKKLEQRYNEAFIIKMEIVEDNIVSLRDINEKFDKACLNEESQ